MRYRFLFQITIALTMICLFQVRDLYSQDVGLTVEVSADTVLMGNMLEIRYTIKNVPGDFKPPAFKDFKIVGGPNMSSSFQMINGKVTQQASYTYYLEPLREGALEILGASVISDKDSLTIDPLKVVVMPNPDGIVERPSGFHYRSKVYTVDSTKTKADSIRMKLKNVKSIKI